MSNQTNTLLLEWAGELMEYFTGTVAERVLQRDIDAGDLEALRFHVSEYAAQKAIEDDHGVIPMPNLLDTHFPETMAMLSALTIDKEELDV